MSEKIVVRHLNGQVLKVSKINFLGEINRKGHGIIILSQQPKHVFKNLTYTAFRLSISEKTWIITDMATTWTGYLLNENEEKL